MLTSAIYVAVSIWCCMLSVVVTGQYFLKIVVLLLL
ncbi:unnamed protein product [Linum tenue]|uniref:NADH dehydrogenase subunit 1 n=1 Tax=Linum tenue TaxID=586396 RepID=A0AAV0S3S9_9ROSI|nr:unnamed protein product [Linum tenue]